MFEKLKDFRDTLSERIKSPFVGSFIITWSLLHWKVYVLMFYEEPGLAIVSRVASVESYLDLQGFYDLLLEPAWITLVVLIAHSILNALGLSIKLLYDNWVSPFIQKVLYEENIIAKAKYEKLKIAYEGVKKDYDSDMIKFLENDKEIKDIKQGFETYKRNSIEIVYTNLTAVFDKNAEWENSYKFIDGKGDTETLKIDLEGFILANEDLITVDDLIASKDGKILIFTKKFIDGRRLQNYLIRDSEFNYTGIEDGNVLVRYKKLPPKKAFSNMVEVGPSH